MTAWLVAALVAAPVAAAIELPGCGIPPEVEAASSLPAELARRCATDAACWRDGMERARALVERHATSYDAHRIRVLVARAAGRALGPEAAATVVAEYRAQAAALPGHPAYEHLIAQLALEGDAYVGELVRIAREAPDYPWVHLSIAYLLRPDPEATVRDRALEALGRFLELCPARYEPVLALLERTEDAAAWSRFGGGLRAEAVGVRDFEVAERLWLLGSRIESGTAEGHARWAESVRADLAQLIGGGWPERVEDLVALRQGYELAGDPDGSARAENRLIERHPCSAPGLAIVGGRLRLRLGDAHALDASKRREVSGELLGRIEPLLARCGDSEGLLTLQVEALALLGPQAGERLRAAVDRWLALDGKARSTPELWAAERLLDAGVALDRAATLVVTARALRTGPGADPEPAAGSEAGRRHELRLAAAIAAAGGDAAAARSHLEELRRGRSTGEAASLTPAERELEARIEAGIACATEPGEAAIEGWADLLSTAPDGGAVEREARRCWVATHGGEEGFAAWRAERSWVARDRGPWRVVDEAAPAARLSDLGRAAVDFGDFAGRTVFVRAWAGWCGPCREELAALAELGRRFGERGDVVIRLVSVDGDPSPVIGLLARNELEVEPLFGDRDLFESGFLERVPSAWIVSPEGRVVRRQTGPAGDDPAAWIEAAAAAIAEVAGPAPAPVPVAAP